MVGNGWFPCAEVLMSLEPRTANTCLCALAFTLGSLVSASPCGAADYFANKSIDLLIGAPPAGGYDIYARAVARHYGRNIPGHPNIIAKNMPGAASGRAAGFLSTIAPKDGTVIAAIMPGAVMAPLLEDKPEILFDPTKVVELIIGQQVFQRSYIAPPGTPAEQLAILRTAFDTTMHDSQFLADADKMRIDISPLPGDKVQDIVQKLHSTPKSIVEKARAA